MKLTQKLVRDYLRVLGGRLRRNVNYNEYVLVFGHGDNEQTYFSDSLEDIVGTARVMLGDHPDIDVAESILAGK